MGEKGIMFEPYQSRIYPHADLYSHILGQIDNDNYGISGVEKYFDKELKKIGGVKNSSHLKGLAVDIHIGGSDDRFALYEALRKVGFKRLGVAKTFIHADIDPDKSPDVMWVY